MFKHKRLMVVGVVVILLAVGGYVYAGTLGGPSYRRATASTGTVKRTLSITGDVTASGRRDLSFGASGTVKKVLVSQGQRVRKGQVLARLDGSELDAQVATARAALAKAQAQLVSDESASSSSGVTASSSSGQGGTRGGGDGPSDAGSNTGDPGENSGDNSGDAGGDTGQGSPGGSGDGGPGGSGGHGSTGTDEEPTLDTSSVSAAQSALTAATGSLTTALNNYVTFVQSSCTSSETTESGQVCDPGAAATACASPTPKPTTLADAKACVAAARSSVSSAAGAMSTAATTVAAGYLTANKKYATVLVERARAQGKAAAEKEKAAAEQQAAGIIAQAQVQAQQMIAQAQQQAAAASKNAAADPTRSQQSGSASSATQIASDRASVASARASLISARQSARGATLRATITGRVVDVGVEKDDVVDTSTTAVTVLGAGDTTVDATLTLAQVRDVEEGQRVAIVPAGWQRTLHGTVTRVGLLASEAASGGTTYPITVTVNQAGRRSPSVPLGTTASLSIVTGMAKDSVTVPTSAVSRSSGGDTVAVLIDGEVTTKEITVGLIGTSRTTIESGLDAGQTVVLADLDATLPGGGSSSTQGGAGSFARWSGPAMAGGGPRAR